MSAVKKTAFRLPRFSPFEWAAIIISLVIACLLLLDPLVFGVVRQFNPEVRGFFRSFTDLGKAGWILIPSGIAIAVLLGLRQRKIGWRKRAAYGYGAQLLAFLFAAVAGASVLGALIKNTLGRARPKLYDQLGSLDFHPFAYTADFASFPSGHATTICALAAALAILWPRGRVFLFVVAAWIAATRFLIGAHYFSDAVAGGFLGAGFALLLRDRMADRRWVFERQADGTIALRGRRILTWISTKLRQEVLQRTPIPARLAGSDKPGSG